MKYKGSTMIHNNWGDDINKYFIEEISNIEVKDLSLSFFYKIFPVKAYSCIGSILGDFPLKKTEVWGSGFIEEGKTLKEKPLKIHSVRGPLTRQELIKQGIDCPEKYGDPALLISRYYRKDIKKKYQYGIVPHYIDENNPILVDFCQKHPEYVVIRMKGYRDWHDIPDQIMQCRRIISSSLHGLIIADSYEIPNVWVRFSDGIAGGDFKYQDYFQSVGRKIESPVIIKSTDDLEYIIINDNTSVASNIDYRSIYEACPFKDQLYDYE
jgi:pyruvyltransferase